MKKLLISLFTLLAFNAHASIINTVSDQLTYNTGDTVLVDFFIQEANPDITWLAFEYDFNNLDLAFEGFFVTDDVYNNTSYDFGFVDDNILTVQINLLPDWSSFLGTSIKLGQAEFTALGNDINADFALLDIYAEDADFNPIAAQAVPEPSTFAIFSLGLLALLRGRCKS